MRVLCLLRSDWLRCSRWACGSLSVCLRMCLWESKSRNAQSCYTTSTKLLMTRGCGHSSAGVKLGQLHSGFMTRKDNARLSRQEIYQSNYRPSTWPGIANTLTVVTCMDHVCVCYPWGMLIPDLSILSWMLLHKCVSKQVLPCITQYPWNGSVKKVRDPCTRRCQQRAV